MARKSRSLRLELVASLAMVLFMAVVSLSLAAELLGQRRHNTQELERLEDHTRAVATLAAHEFRAGDSVDREALTQLLRQNTASQFGVSALRIYVVGGTDGEREARLVVSAGIAYDFPPPTSAEPRIDDSQLDARHTVIIDEPIPTFNARVDGNPVLRVIAEPSAWTQGHDWRETMIVATGVGGILLLLGFLLVEMLVLRPLRAVEKAAGEVAAGNFAARIPKDGAVEFQQVAEAFNRMTQALGTQRTQLGEQRQQLQRSEQMATIGRLAAGVAHEVGNPLAAILGYTEFLLDPRSKLEPERRELLERIQSQTQRIQTIVHQLVDYSRPSPTQVQAVKLAERAQEVVKLLAADPVTKGVELETRGDPQLEASADPALLEQVLLNVIVNACHAAKAAHAEDSADDESKARKSESPRVVVRVGASEEDETGWIEVQDNGDGVDAETRERLFEPFFSTRLAGEGTGLGLAISQGLVESMSGTLECLESGARSPLADGGASGAVFRISLPRTTP